MSEAPLTGEPLALDLVNTRTSTADLLATPHALHDWLTLQAPRLPDPPFTPTPADLALIHAVRAHTTHALNALLHPSAQAVVPPGHAAMPPGRRATASGEAARDGARSAVTAERGALAEALEGLNAAQAAAPAITELGWDGTAVTAVRRRAGEPGVRLAAWLAEAAADLLADPAVTTIRQCAADDCVMLFLPAHPRRQWCSPTRCGNRTRVARHYHRHQRP